MLDELATPCRNVCGPYAALSLNGWRTPGYSSDSTYITPLESITVSRLARFSCSAAEPVTSLKAVLGVLTPQLADLLAGHLDLVDAFSGLAAQIGLVGLLDAGGADVVVEPVA